MVLLKVMSGGEEAVALAGLETISAAGMSEGKVGWMVLAAASAVGLLWELESGTGFMWRGRGLMSWAPRLDLEAAKAVTMYGGYTMQKMKSDENIISNMFARTGKDWQCQNFPIQGLEGNPGNASVCMFFYSVLRFYLSLIPLQRPQT